MNWDQRYGLPFPLGQSWYPDTQSYNFALYSKHADRVQLVLFAADDLRRPCAVFDFQHLDHKTGRIWHLRLPRDRARGARYYAYRVWGPEGDGEFDIHAFDPEKLACDPYARRVYFPPGFDTMAAIEPGDNTGRAPVTLLREEAEAPMCTRSPGLAHNHDAVIYEMHVKGFTQRENSGVSPAHRGTWRGVIEKIPYLQELGVTMIELMPVFQFNPQEGNYWGYNPLFFFVPHNEYSTCPERPDVVEAEFREMVDALHAAGFEVILDVVYNHTGEGNEEGPKFSLKLIDQSTYYMLEPATGRHQNHSGTGNTLHCANPAVRRLILDSMHYWMQEMGIDGFRFDLAAVLTRNSDGSINWNDPPLLSQIASDPILRNAILIAEPWDISSYQLGRTFRGIQWCQWNGKYRDAIQRYVRGDPGLAGEMATRVYGSSDLFPDTVYEARRPYQSINYFNSHDGFTLYDLVSYNHKNNWANGEENRDGHDDYSWNCGYEGDENVPEDVAALRLQQMKNFMLLLMLSNGIPMIRMGDEFAQTQGGNNNPWNQDNETSWLDWDRLQRFRELFLFTKSAIAFRKAHPSIARHRFWREDVAWYGSEGAPDWSGESRDFAWFLSGEAEADNDLYVISNASPEAKTFTIQRPGPWRVVADTARPSPEDFFPHGDGPLLDEERYRAEGRSTVVLMR